VPAIALALGSSLVYGVSDFLGGLKSRSLPLLSVLLVSQGSALIALMVAVAASGTEAPEGEFLLYGAIAGLAEAVGVAAFYRGLAVGVMSIVSPIAATAPVVPVVAAILLGELPGTIQVVGIVLAVAGVGIISLEPERGESARDLTPSILFGMLTALGFGGFLVAMDAASEGGVLWALFVVRLASVTAFASAFLIRRAPLGVRRGGGPGPRPDRIPDHRGGLALRDRYHRGTAERRCRVELALSGGHDRPRPLLPEGALTATPAAGCRRRALRRGPDLGRLTLRLSNRVLSLTCSPER
jgi:uncharacterized membrane protein